MADAKHDRVGANSAGDGGDVQRPDPVRRRLVKGSAASLPAIMTLHSGAVLAQASSLECLSRRTDNPDPLPTQAIDPATPDNWARGYCARQDFKGGGPQFTTYLDPVTGDYRDPITGKVVVIEDNMMTDGMQQNNHYLCAAYVDDSGNVNAHGPTDASEQPVDGLMVGGSCWISVCGGNDFTPV